MAIALIIRDAANAPQTVATWLPRDAANVQQTTAAAYDRDTGNASELFYNPSGSEGLAVTVSPTSVSGYGTVNATTDTCTATAAGGTAPYTYAWTLVSTDSNTDPEAFNPTSAATVFTITNMNPNAVYTSQWQVTVTDANSNTASTTATANFADTSP